MLFHKYKKIIMVLISILLLVAILTPLLYNYYTSDERIYPSNQNYPLYNLLDLTLNNETRGNITAQVLKFNDTSDNWDVNSDLIQLVQEDLKKAVESIENLDEISLYSINSSFLPGELCFILVTEISEAKSIITTLISDILSNNETFWYIENVSFPVFDISAMAHGKTLEYNAIFLMEIYTGHTVYSEYGSNCVCKELDGLIASTWIKNDSSWVRNTPFRELVINDLTGFVDRIIEIESFFVSFDDNINFDVVVCRPLISYGIKLRYNQDSDRNQQFKNYFILCSMLKRLWYVESIFHGICDCPIDSSWQFSTLIFAFVILLVFKNSRRKDKHSNNDKYVVRGKIIY